MNIDDIKNVYSLYDWNSEKIDETTMRIRIRTSSVLVDTEGEKTTVTVLFGHNYSAKLCVSGSGDGIAVLALLKGIEDVCGRWASGEKKAGNDYKRISVGDVIVSPQGKRFNVLDVTKGVSVWYTDDSDADSTVDVEISPVGGTEKTRIGHYEYSKTGWRTEK